VTESGNISVRYYDSTLAVVTAHFAGMSVVHAVVAGMVESTSCHDEQRIE